MKKILEIIPFFIVTIPLFLIIHIEGKYHNLITYKFVWKEITELFAAPLIITGILFLAFRDFRKSAVFALPVILVFYFFSDLKDFLNKWNSKIFLSSYSFLLPLLIFALIGVLLAIKKSKSDFRNIFLYVNILFFVLIIYEAGAMATGKSFNTGQKDPSTSAAGYNPCDSCDRPDIYYLVFDAYTSSDVLRSEFKYDNSDLDSFLSKRNFFMVRKSTSNYNLTPFSIGSTFNFDYLHSLNTEKDFFLNEYLPGVSIVYNSDLIKILRKEAYTIFNHSIFDFASASSTIPHFDVWELDLVYKRHNIFRKIDADIGWLIRRQLGIINKSSANVSADVQYKVERDKHVTNTLSALFKTIETKAKSPAFIYAHILLPHSPYTYDSLGNKLPLTGPALTPEDKKAAYVGQVAYVNQIMKKMVDSIFRNSKNNFIIILQGDHGARYQGEENKKNLEFANLNAMYFYNQDYRLLHDSLSNVNTFRVIFNTFFGKNYPLLKDRSYFLRYR